MRNTINQNLFYRSFALDRQVDPETHSIPVSFSSETPVERWFGNEILLHGDENVDLTRLLTMGSALLNHSPNIIVGRLEDVRLEDKRGLASICFDQDEDGKKAEGKVNSGSLRGLSVGYQVNTFREIQEDEEWNGIKGPAYVATRWTPFEISLTPIPADASVGVGREMTRSLEGIVIEQRQLKREVKGMDKEEILRLIREALAQAVPEIAQQVRSVIAEEGRPRIRVNAEELLELNGQAAAIGGEAQIRVGQLVAEGRSADQVRGELLKLATTRTDARDTAGTDPIPGNPKVQAVKDMPEDMFVRMVTNPAMMTLQ